MSDIFSLPVSEIVNHIKEAKIILSQLEFKLKNYQESYNILKDINNIDNYKIDLAEDLIKVNQFNLAQTIISDLIRLSKNTKIIDKSIYQLARLYEMQTTEGLSEFTITKDIYKNELLNSPFIKLNSNYSDLLFKAIDIYDSLRTYRRDYKASFQLAEIKYKIQGDLEGAETIYENIYKNKVTSFLDKFLPDDADYYVFADVQLKLKSDTETTAAGGNSIISNNEDSI